VTGDVNASTWIPIATSVIAVLIAGWSRIEVWRATSRSKTAYLGARQQDATAANPDDTYTFTITNAGPAVARNVVARVMDADAEKEFVREIVKAAIPIGQEVNLTLNVPSAVRAIHLALWADWTDDRRRHTDEELLVLRPPDDPLPPMVAYA
jgi:hypothetical protein